MTLEAEDRIAIIAYSYGVACCSHDSNINFQNAKIRIDATLVILNEPIMTKDEMQILEQLDNLMYVFQLNSSNRDGFRKTTMKDSHRMKKITKKDKEFFY